jgi:hypothetical protein
MLAPEARSMTAGFVMSGEARSALGRQAPLV